MDHRCFLEGYCLQLLQYILLHNVHCHKTSLYHSYGLFHKLLNFAAVWLWLELRMLFSKAHFYKNNAKPPILPEYLHDTASYFRQTRSKIWGRIVQMWKYRWLCVILIKMDFRTPSNLTNLQQKKFTALVRWNFLLKIC